MSAQGEGERRDGWQEYYRQHSDRPPREELIQALEAVVETHDDLGQLQALEVGAGTLVETRALLEAGFGKVIATDKSPLAEEKAAEIEHQFNDFARDIERLSFHRLANEDLAARLSPESVDVIVSYFRVAFYEPRCISAVVAGA